MVTLGATSAKAAEGGFTIVEVLVTCVIIGTLTMLAIPFFAHYKAQSFNVRADSDLHDAITAEEANFDATDNYVGCGPTDCPTILPGFALSGGVRLTIEVTTDHYSVSACHDLGNKIYSWDSQTGTYVTADFSGVCTPAPPAIS